MWYVYVFIQHGKVYDYVCMGFLCLLLVMFLFIQGNEVLHFVLIAGEPLNEPIVQHGKS